MNAYRLTTIDKDFHDFIGQFLSELDDEITYPTIKQKEEKGLFKNRTIFYNEIPEEYESFIRIIHPRHSLKAETLNNNVEKTSNMRILQELGILFLGLEPVYVGNEYYMVLMNVYNIMIERQKNDIKSNKKID